MQATTGLGGDAVDHAETETAALAGLLGREKRLDRPPQHLVGHALPGIRNRDQHIIARSEVRSRLAPAHIGCADRQAAAFGHRVAGVDRQVQQHQLDLRGIDQRRPQSVGQHGLDAHGGTDRAKQHIGGFAHQPVQIERGRGKALLARESEQLVSQSRASFGRQARGPQSPQ